MPRPTWDISNTDSNYFIKITNRIIANDFVDALRLLKIPCGQDPVDRSDLIFAAGVFCLDNKGTAAAYQFFSALSQNSSDLIYRAAELCRKKKDTATAIKLFSTVSIDSKEFQLAYNRKQELERILDESKEETAGSSAGNPPGGAVVNKVSFFNQSSQTTAVSMKDQSTQTNPEKEKGCCTQ